MLKYFSLFFLVVAVVSCKPRADDDSEAAGDDALLMMGKAETEVPRYVAEGIISNISSLLEEAFFLKQIGVPFEKKHLAATTNVERVSDSELLSAFNLGALGLNLGYMSVYQQIADLPHYLETISVLSGKLNIDGQFDHERLLRIARNQGDIDSLTYFSLHGYNRLNEYMLKNSKEHLSALMATGLFLEGLYLLTQVAQLHHTDDLAGRIGEQKIMLNDLLLAMRFFQNEYEPLKDIADELEKIQKEFRDVEITYEMGEPETVEKDGRLVIIQNEKSRVDISGETLARITANTEKIRNQYVF